jgi:hypothetical protein
MEPLHVLDMPGEVGHDLVVHPEGRPDVATVEDLRHRVVNAEIPGRMEEVGGKKDQVRSGEVEVHPLVRDRLQPVDHEGVEAEVGDEP